MLPGCRSLNNIPGAWYGLLLLAWLFDLYYDINRSARESNPATRLARTAFPGSSFPFGKTEP
uniref:Uncharacterized protein n=1 Tax=Utricularia reniformis TaxID=192314 RepID=A0A1Y0AZD2_9LAMI|nr:hypothetical protein AEK19_MT0265 [Utricularia reniformis]ART30542.1 hypothetical protein AEK19_MT0265 [Utricularia reniformis]